MYHIKPDKRSRTSAAEIVRGMEECLKVMPLHDITISDIHRATGISRATFYRLFDTPEDVLCYRLDRMMASALNNRFPQAKSFLEETIRMGMENHDFMKAIIDNGRFDLLFQYTEKTFREIENRERIFPEGMEGPEREFMIAQLSMTMVASMIAWNRNGRKESSADQVRYLRNYLEVLTGLLGEENTAGS